MNKIVKKSASYILENVKFINKTVRVLRNTPADQRVLWRMLLLEHLPKNSICAEVGVWKGAFSRKILKYTKPKRLYLIDPWRFQPKFSMRKYGGKDVKSQREMDKIYNDVKKSLGTYDRVKIIRDYSNEASDKLEEDLLDWVYIDGNHNHEYVKKDLKIYRNKVKSGGYISGDDYLWGDKKGLPVKRAVDEFVRQNEKAELESIFQNQYLIKK